MRFVAVIMRIYYYRDSIPVIRMDSELNEKQKRR